MPLSLNALLNIPTREEKFTTKRDQDLAEKRKQLFGYIDQLEREGKAKDFTAEGDRLSGLFQTGLGMSPEEATKASAAARSSGMLGNLETARKIQGGLPTATLRGTEAAGLESAKNKGEIERLGDISTLSAAKRSYLQHLGEQEANLESARQGEELGALGESTALRAGRAPLLPKAAGILGQLSVATPEANLAKAQRDIAQAQQDANRIRLLGSAPAMAELAEAQQGPPRSQLATDRLRSLAGLGGIELEQATRGNEAEKRYIGLEPKADPLVRRLVGQGADVESAIAKAQLEQQFYQAAMNDPELRNRILGVTAKYDPTKVGGLSGYQRPGGSGTVMPTTGPMTPPPSLRELLNNVKLP